LIAAYEQGQALIAVLYEITPAQGLGNEHAMNMAIISKRVEVIGNGIEVCNVELETMANGK
jgi:hypothetical protein